MGTHDFIYGVSSKYNSEWEHRVYVFDSEDKAKEWLKKQEYDFRERELFERNEAINLAGLEAVEDAEYAFYDSF